MSFFLSVFAFHFLQIRLKNLGVDREISYSLNEHEHPDNDIIARSYAVGAEELGHQLLKIVLTTTTFEFSENGQK
jgi:hypothetical protein